MRQFFLRGFFFALQMAVVIVVGYFCFEWIMGAMVHSRPERVVPNLKNKTLREAISEVSKLNLGLAQESEEFAPEFAVGTVVKQYPPAGSKVREGKIISVVTSMGSEKISVPDLEGLSLRKAEIEIKAAKLALGETRESYSLKYARGFVMAQDPKPLVLAEKGELVHLTVSLGEPPSHKLIIPDFIGQEVERASAWAKDNNVSIFISEDWRAPEGEDGKVIRQNLTPDALYDKNSAAAANLKLEVTVARRSRAQAARYIEYQVPEKPRRRRELVLKIIAKGAEREVFRTVAQPGENVKIPLTEEMRMVRARIYLDGIFTEEKNLQ